MANIRAKAAEIIQRVEEGAYTNLLLNEALSTSQLDPRDKALLTNIVKGTLQWKTRLDAAIRPHVKQGLKKISPEVLSVLRTGAYQLLFLDKVPDHAAINESVEAIKKTKERKASGLVNAVLRRVSENKDQHKDLSLEDATPKDIARAYSHPTWLVKRWIKDLDLETTLKLLEQNNSPWPVCIRTNTLKTTTEELRKTLTDADIDFEPAEYDRDCTRLPGLKSIDKLPSSLQGLFFIQDESSSLVTRLLSPQPGSTVIDLCASPGGKSASMALLMNNEGQITAVDLNEKKCKVVADKCLELGVKIVSTVSGDARSINIEPADYVLVDAPCTGFGVLGRKPEIRWNKTEKDVEELSKLQLEILDNAAELVIPGGKLAYSTCTLLDAENKDVVEAFLAKHPDFTLLKPDPEYPTRQNFFCSIPGQNQMAGSFCALFSRS